MLGASKRLLLLNNAGRRFYQRSASVERVLSARLLRPNLSLPKNGRVEHLLSKQKQRTFTALSGTKFDALDAEETGVDAKREDAEHEQEMKHGNGAVEATSQPKGTNRSYRNRDGKFRNYSNSDYQNVESLRIDFLKLAENPDAKITPVTAYQFIRNCGNRMAAETSENRIGLAQEIWEKLKEKDVELETTHYNALLSVYIQNRHKFSPLEFLAEMQESKIQPDKSTYVLIVQAYCQEGDLSGALRVVDFMTKQGITVSEPIYTALITGHSRNNDMEGAHKILTAMRENNITPQVDSYTALISGYAASGDLEGIDHVFAEMKENDVSTNTLLYMNLLDSFCRHGHSSLIPEGLSRIKHKAPIEMEMRYFIQRLITRGDYESAAILAKNNEAWLPAEMLNQEELSPQNLFFYRLIRANKTLDEMIRATKTLESHGLTQTPLEDVLELCHARKLTDDAIKMLAVLKENGRRVKPHYAYPMLKQLSEKEDLDGILNLLSYMNDNSIKIDATVFDIAGKAFKKAEGDRIGELMDFVREKGLRLSWRLSNENIDSILKGDSVQAFLDILPSIHVGMVGTREKSDKIAEFLVRTFDTEETSKAIIALDQKNLFRLGWVLSKVLEPFNIDHPERAKDAFKIFNTLVKAGAMKGLNNFCYTLLLNIFLKNSMKDEFFQVVDVMKEQGIEPNEAQYFIMLKMSSLIGNSAAAQFCFDKLKASHDPTEAQYNALLISYGKDSGKGRVSDEPNQQYTKKIVSLYEEIEERGLKPLGLTISQVLVTYLSMGKLEEAEKVRSRHGLGVEHRRYAVYNEYLRLFSKQGKADEAEKIFNEMKESETGNLISLFSYNQLIGAHKVNGNVERVLELIDELKEYGFTPNRITASELTKCYMRRGEPEKALPMLEEIVDNENVPSANILTALVAEFFEKNDVESCERGVALIRKKTIDEWGEQRLKHILLMMYLKDENFAAARDIVEKADFRLTQRLIMAALGETYKNIDFLLKMKGFLRDNNLNYFLMDLAILNAYIAKNDADAALQLYEEKKANDSAMTNYFLKKLANFLSASGREVPFDTSILSQKAKQVQKEEELKDVAVEVEDKAVDLNVTAASESTETNNETPLPEKE